MAHEEQVKPINFAVVHGRHREMYGWRRGRRHDPHVAGTQRDTESTASNKHDHETTSRFSVHSVRTLSTTYHR
ncbi:unnamed protein product [Macrosiphum euphorbiae]|uniref:Uncharacterized protein n=1 Tax=Macrosiphum euphorbiae TaxID=13131 RepID=A0AAV0Y1X3_9HEMI|nr:unnamed protein product [Macrosiphum euphorbiae]